MVTYFVGVEEVTAYLRDFLDRLSQFDPFPNLWCPITPSGNALLVQLLSLVKTEHPEWIDKVSVLPIQIERDGGPIRFDSDCPAQDVANKSVLLLDTSIHSGSTMSRSVAQVVEMGASEVCAYSLMLKCDSAFIPTLWGFMIGRTDRAFLLLDRIPNNRMAAEAMGHHPTVHLERLSEGHAKKPQVVCGLDSMDRTTWGDRLFDMVTGGQGQSSYLLLKKDEVLGYLTIHGPEDGCLTIDEIALDEKHHGKRLGGILLRFADSLARQSDCKFIRLYAISNKVDFYKKFGYRIVSAAPVRLGEEEYFLMERSLLHLLPKAAHLPPT